MSSPADLGMDRKEPPISIVVLHYNGRRFIERCIDSLLRCRYDNCELIIMDNRSVDGGYEFLQKAFSGNRNVRILQNQENYGYTGGFNRAIPYIRPESKYVVFVAQDTACFPDSLSQLVDFMQTHDRVGAAHPKILLMDGVTIDSAGHFLDSMGFTYHRGQHEFDWGQYSNGQVTYAYGTFFILRRDIIDRISIFGDLFDPDYFYYHEDADLCWRVRLFGFKIWYVGTSVVLHEYGGSSMAKGIPASLVFHHTKNRSCTLIKNYSFRNLVRYFPLLVVAELSRAFVTAPSRPSHARVTLTALAWVLRHFKRIYLKRGFVQRNIRRQPDSEIEKVMLRPSFHLLIKKYRSYLGVAR